MDWLPNNIIETFHIDPEVAMKLCKKLCRDMHNAIYEESQSGWYMRVEYADAESETYIFHHDHAAAELSDYIRKTLNRYDLCVPCTGRNYVENTKIRNAAFRIVKERTSRLLTLSLRHKPHVIGISIDEYGWADVDELIACVTQKTREVLTRELLEEIVETDKKHTFSFNEDKTKIRVNEKHTFPVKQIVNEAE